MESRFFKRSLDRIKPVESRNESISKEEVQETAKDSSMGEEEKASIIEMDRLQIVPKYSPDPVSASSFAKDVNDVELSLLPHATDPGYNDEGMHLQKRYNFKSKNQTPDWQEVQETAKDSSIGEEKEDSIELDLLNMIKSPDPFEFSLFPYTPQRDNDGVTDLLNRCVMMQKASPISEACLEFGKMPTMQFNAESSEFVPLFHRDRRRRFSDFEAPRNRQIMSNNNIASWQSSSRCVVPYIGVDLNPIAMSSSPENLRGSNSTMYSRDICGQETLEIEPRGDVVRELDDVPAEKAGVMPILQSSAEFAECMRRRRFLDFNTPRNRQIMSDNNMASGESYSRFVIPYIGVDLNPIAMSSARNLPDSRRNSEKKRPKFQAREIESCKRCTCKKSKCLKLYCDCFAIGAYCGEACSCIDCLNKPGHEDVLMASRKQIESRNPFAFAPKVIKSSDSVPETETGTGDDASKTKSLALARHTRGCNCKKSNCLKKYCECYQAGVGCSRKCRCEGCNNTSGRMGG